MKNINDFDEIQLNLMIEQLVLFESRKLDLGVLLTNLEGLFHKIEKMSDEWEDNFLNNFSVLESINAEMPKMEESKINNLISQTVCNLKKMIDERLKQH